MQRVTIVRYTTRPECTAENEALSRAVFKELKATNPAGIAYGVFRDGDDFLHVFTNLREDASAEVTELPAFKAFDANIRSRCLTPPQPVRVSAQLLDSFGMGK